MANMKSSPAVPNSVAAKQVTGKKAAESRALGLTEQRRSVRNLPVPDVSETDHDSAWAAFTDFLDDEKKD